jgi:hypothetical protein
LDVAIPHNLVPIHSDKSLVYFGDPLNHEDDKHLCPTRATSRYPILMSAINDAPRLPHKIAPSTFHPDCISTRLAIDFALLVSAATTAERQSAGPDFGVRNYQLDQNDSSKLMLSFGDKKNLLSIEVSISDIDQLNLEPAAKLLRSAITTRPTRG